VRGFSLVEVLLATSLLATGVLGLAHVLAVAVGVNVASRQTTSATVLAAQKVEEILAGGDIGGSEDAVDGFRRRWTAQSLPGSSTRLMIVQVIVEPSVSLGGRGRPARVTAVVAGRP
jgi:Tfp pilus assembly protein PilV